MFHITPKIETNAEHSYFQASLNLHRIIRKDLNDILMGEVVEDSDTTIEQVHTSLQKLEKQLFGSESKFDVDIKGCCLYTRSLEGRLTTSSRCHVV